MHPAVHQLRSIFFQGSTALVDLDLLINEVWRSHSNTPNSVGLLWASDRPVLYKLGGFEWNQKWSTSAGFTVFSPAPYSRSLSVYVLHFNARGPHQTTNKTTFVQEYFYLMCLDTQLKIRILNCTVSNILQNMTCRQLFHESDFNLLKNTLKFCHLELTKTPS
jgi:hypothetical protein